MFSSNQRILRKKLLILFEASFFTVSKFIHIESDVLKYKYNLDNYKFKKDMGQT